MRSVSNEILAAIISGAAAVGVAIVAAMLSYWFGTRTLKYELNNRLAELRESGTQDRATAEREYQLQAMKTFREAVGGPKSQIIEAVHDLSDRLRRFLSGEQSWDWTADSGYYRRSFTWLTIRPFVWMEILRRSMVYLDQTLGELVEGELRFLGYCRLLERAVTEAALFRNTNYDPNVASAHVFAGSLRAIAEQLIKDDNSGLICMGYREFDEESTSPGISCAGDVERIISDLGTDGPGSSFKLARLVALYCATNALLEHFALPFRKFEPVDGSLTHIQLISEELRDPISANLQEMLSETRTLIEAAAD